MDNKVVTRRELFEVLKKHGHIQPLRVNSRRILCEFIINTLDIRDSKQYVDSVVLSFCSDLQKKWKLCGRNSKRFVEAHPAWLSGELNFKTKKQSDNEQASSSRGRPQKTFEEGSEKTKKRRVAKLLQSHTAHELSFAARVSLQMSGKRSAATVVKETTETTPTRAAKIKKAFRSPPATINKFTAEEALGMIVNLNLSKYQYISMRQLTNDKGMNIYPSYEAIKKAKLDCYPETGITVTETSAEIRVQCLLDCTARRLIKLQEAVFSLLKDNMPEDLEIVYKWGFDGSSGQRQYKQKYGFGSPANVSDSDLLLTSVVPIQMCGLQNGAKVTIWQNPRVSSTRYCRPLHFQFKKETKANTKAEIDHIQSQIDVLLPTTISVGDLELSVNHKLFLTMVDGKVCNALTDTFSQVCYICGASPKTMNNLSAVKKRECDELKYSFGLSTLHAYIRFFECLLHISYKLDIKKWQSRSEYEKNSVKTRQDNIKKLFWDEMGLLVDQTRQGSGSSNDGNTARTFFKQHTTSANITDINVALINRFSTILRALSSGFEINLAAFDKYANDTAQLYVDLYGWYPMPVTVHKVLLHGTDVIKHFMVPIGQLGEDAQEARNKDYRYYREHRTRKISRVKTNEDLLHLLLISSDPLISGNRSTPKKKAEIYPREVLDLLKYPDVPYSEKTYSDSDSESE